MYRIEGIWKDYREMAERYVFPKFGQKHLVRFQWTSAKQPKMEREEFTKKVLFGALKLKAADMFCLQDNPAGKGYDVTLHSSEKCRSLKERFELHKGEEPLAFLKCYNLDHTDYRLVTVHMYNPHVTAETIEGFLLRYARVDLGKRKDCKDTCGIWNGKRMFCCYLKSDPGGYDGLVHPPALFSIGADRGYLYYARQPLFCKKCRGNGHREDTCKGLRRCRFCAAEGHLAEDCPSPKACHTCGATDHLAKSCPKRCVAGGGRPGGGRNGQEEASAEASKGTGEMKDGARTGSQAFKGNGASNVAPDGKKARMNGKTEEEMDVGVEMTGGLDQAEGEMVAGLSFVSGLPAGLFGPPSPAPSEGTPTWGERVEEEGPT